MFQINERKIPLLSLTVDLEIIPVIHNYMLIMHHTISALCGSQMF